VKGNSRPTSDPPTFGRGWPHRSIVCILNIKCRGSRREGLVRLADAISNGSSEPPPAPTVSLPFFHHVPGPRHPRTKGKQLALKNSRHAAMWSAPLNSFYSEPDPGGTTHIRLTSLPSQFEKKKKKIWERERLGWVAVGERSRPSARNTALRLLSSLALRTYRRGDVASSRGHLFAGFQSPAPRHLFRWTHWAWKGSDRVLNLYWSRVQPSSCPNTLPVSFSLRPRQDSFSSSLTVLWDF
jgi:hypothetical protein